MATLSLKNVTARAAITGWLRSHATLLRLDRAASPAERYRCHTAYQEAKATLTGVLANHPDKRHSDSTGVYFLAVDSGTGRAFPSWRRN